MSNGRGVSLVEMVVTLALTGLLSAALLGLLSRFDALLQTQPIRVAKNDALRLAHVVLRSELREADVGDIAAVGSDSLRLRAFRGAAIACAAEDSALLVRYHGIRAPDPAKDSVLILVGETETAAALAAVNAVAGGCAARPGEAIQRWRIPATYEPGALLLIFESGTYAVAGGAFRYRRGDSGRQPLTAEVFPNSAHFDARDARGAPLGPASDFTSLRFEPFASPSGADVRGRGAHGVRVVLANAHGAGAAP